MKRALYSISISFVLLCTFAAVAFSADGSAVFQRCANCHGSDGAKPPYALKGQKADAVLAKLKRYADGSFGGSRKDTMKGVAQRLSPEEMQAVADYIGKL